MLCYRLNVLLDKVILIDIGYMYILPEREKSRIVTTSAAWCSFLLPVRTVSGTATRSNQGISCSFTGNM